MARDRGDEESERVTWTRIWTTSKDWKTWAFAYMYMSAAIGAYAFTLFLPTILQDSLHFSTALAVMLAALLAIFSVIVAMAISWAADKARRRGPYLVCSASLVLSGFV